MRFFNLPDGCRWVQKENRKRQTKKSKLISSIQSLIIQVRRSNALSGSELVSGDEEASSTRVFLSDTSFRL